MDSLARNECRLHWVFTHYFKYYLLNLLLFGFVTLFPQYRENSSNELEIDFDEKLLTRIDDENLKNLKEFNNWKINFSRDDLDAYFFRANEKN
jgi:hypothetical protein